MLLKQRWLFNESLEYFRAHGRLALVKGLEAVMDILEIERALFQLTRVAPEVVEEKYPVLSFRLLEFGIGSNVRNNAFGVLHLVRDLRECREGTALMQEVEQLLNPRNSLHVVDEK